MHPLIHVYSKDQLAGIFDMDANERIGRFEWLPAFESAFDRLTNVFEKDDSYRYTPFDANKNLPDAFMDYLPGAFSKSLLREALRNSTTTVDGLSTLAWLSLTGDRGMGIFRFEPAGYPELNVVVAVDLDRMVRFASLVQHGKGAELSDRRLRELLRCGLTVKGNSPKILVAVNDFTGEVLSGQGSIPKGYEGWILKLDGVYEGSSTLLAQEYTYHQMAMNCGIQVAACRMLHDGHWKHLLVKRFDRLGGEKRAFVNCPASICSWEDVFRLMRSWKLPYPDMEEMYKRLIFSILTRNENYGPSKIAFTFTAQEAWRLAPAYNLKPSESTKGHRFSLIGKTFGWTDEELLGFGKQLNIRKAKQILCDIHTHTIS